MRFLASLMVMAGLLGACAPMAMFASGNGLGYSGLDTDWGTYVSHDNVNAFCLSPKLRLLIWDIEGHFGRKIVMNSGYRTPWHNASVGGASSSYHTKCMAADIYIPGVEKDRLIAYAFRNSLTGGLGCYPGQRFVHIDVRDRGRRSTPVTFSGC
ncbi:YcbK family protein [Pelagibacterium xiamenense]|uniref:YcbK family protein n=1 Tax=Pelagibacterium xiamenense TaxID=2901140 RepID=UPI001E516C1C|nr:D-Ala-D-Ala carboxypeptidase family metallohydrolase [Pelagibacterium xiamenense]MCD7060858.1 D-Ala-D-Ala carboxypeptidase family metallohydrolase [Pelagibacterium xiamenense]